MSKIKKNYILIVFSIFVTINISAFSASNYESTELFGLSFEELMSTKVQSGSLLFMSNSDKPAMVTTITSDEIRYSPHRNIYDLIESYVPGAIFMSHYDSPSIGIRGIIADRNYKVLLMVNGRVANQKARVGAISELENWSLGDIDKIEVIRGAGSVIYGPGAIAAVINIITKTIESNDASDIRVNYVNPYNSIGVSAKISHRINDNISVFGYASIQQTKGYEPEEAYVFMNNNLTEAQKKSDYKFQEYLGDYFDIPQKKIHFQINLYNDFKFWIRYTNSGMPSNGAYYRTQYQESITPDDIQILGDYRRPLQVKNEHFYATLEHEHQFTDDLTLSSTISWDSENNARTMGYFWSWLNRDAPSEKIRLELIDPSSLRNKYNNFSESELVGNFVLRGIINNDFRIATGTSLSFNRWSSPWFEESNMIRMGDYSNIISGTDSPVYGQSLFFGVDSAKAIFVGDGWSTFMYSFFGEIEYDTQHDLKLLFSARLDKDSYSDYLFSPKFAIIFNIDNNNNLKLIAQQSNRMNTEEEMFLENRAGNVSKPEKLNTIELIYSTSQFDKLLIETSAFYNNIDILSWYDPIRTTLITGNLSYIGAEFEVKYNTNILSIGMNHSYTKLLKWKLSDDISRSGISFSDYKFEFKGNSTTGYGNNLNNWADNITKLYSNINLIDNKMVIHINAKLIWGFEGSKNGLKIVEDIIKGTDSEENVKEIIDFMKSIDVYEYDFRLNASLNYRYISKSVISVYLINITDIGNNYRYKYEAGNKTEDYLFRLNLLKEPFTFGIQISYEI